MRNLYFISILIAIIFIGCNSENAAKNPPIASDTIQKKSIFDTTTKAKSIEYQKIKFSDVTNILYINYTSGLKSGKYLYKEYTITPEEKEFIVKVKYRSGMESQFVIPYTKEEQKKTDSKPSSKNDSLQLQLSRLKPVHYVSEKEIYTVNNKSYTVYRHVDYNCYDPFCSSKHNHVTTETGETYFSPDYGILIKVIGEMQTEILSSIKGKDIPRDLIIHILKLKEMSKKVLWQYTEDTK